MPPAYPRLQRLFARLADLDGAISMLHWDMSAVMPSGGAESRAGQLATLKALHHEMLTAPQVEDLLAKAAGESLDDWQSANLAEMRRDWVHAAALPSDLVEALSKAASTCEMVWRQAKPASDFAAVKASLAEMLRLTREAAKVKSERLNCSVYDALLDQYEPGGKSEHIDRVFADLEGFLPDFLGEVLGRQGEAGPAPSGPFPIERQRELGLKLMEVLGFDFEHGRLDVSSHPFCGGTPGDVRITTRYDEANFMRALMGVLHETGHALYEMGLPRTWRGQPVGRSRGMSVHESQSLLMEMQACRTREFLDFAAPLMAGTFGGSGSEWEADTMHHRAIRVQRGHIRVDADEVTYPIHVILRYRLERALIEDRMQIEDLPQAWNEIFEKMMGIAVPDHCRGCLQDIHWFGGSWGYFPTYTLGAMTAAQLFDAAKRADGDILPGIGQGDFGPLLAWLRANVHAKASRYSSDELLTQATGRPLEAEVFKRHLRARYLPQ